MIRCEYEYKAFYDHYTLKWVIKIRSDEKYRDRIRNWRLYSSALYETEDEALKVIQRLKWQK